MPIPGFSPWKNSATNYLKSIFKNAPAQTPTQTPGQMTNPLPGMQTSLPGYYQVKSSDTFASIGQQFGVPENKLQDLNKALTAPPKGTYIVVNPNATLPRDNPALNTYYNQYRQMLGNRAPQPAAVGTQPSGMGGAINYAQDINGIVASIQSSPVPPAAVPDAALGQLTINGQPATPQLMITMGYQKNPTTQVWTLGGASAQGGGGPTDFTKTQSYQNIANTPFLQQKRWDPKARKYVKIGTLIRQGKLDLKGHWRGGNTLPWLSKGRGQQEVAYVPPAEATNAPGTPQTVLGLHLGSG